MVLCVCFFCWICFVVACPGVVLCECVAVIVVCDELCYGVVFVCVACLYGQDYCYVIRFVVFVDVSVCFGLLSDFGCDAYVVVVIICM